MQAKSTLFRLLVRSPEKLQKNLFYNPALLSSKDENGMTVAHHVAEIGLSMEGSEACRIIFILFNSPGLELNIKDNFGNTAIHHAAIYATNYVNFEYVFPAFLREAEKRKFNFSFTNLDGETVLHLVTKLPYINFLLNRKSNIQTMLKIVANPGLNILSFSGKSPLFCAIELGFYDEAKTLLEAGADPIFNCKEKIPLTKLEENIDNYNKLPTLDDFYFYFENEYIFQKMIDLKNKMLSTSLVKSYAEIRKNARILAQGFCNSGSFFSHLPREIITKIISYSGFANTYNEEKTEWISREHFCKPTRP